MKILHICLSVALLANSSPALAASASPERVLELFTSQGCSSCPPANEIAGKIAQDPSTLVLSYGVTYWDYLGWKDTFAKAEFTRRQRDYGRALGSANVYTPQMVLNGSAHGPHYSKKDVDTMTLPNGHPRIMLDVKQDHLRAEAKGVAAKLASAVYEALLVEYVPGPQSVPVARGENNGRIITLSNVVTALKPLGKWDAQSDLQTEVMPKPGKAYAVLLHDPVSMKITAAGTYSAN